jgi:hypothetical protein
MHDLGERNYRQRPRSRVRACQATRLALGLWCPPLTRTERLDVVLCSNGDDEPSTYSGRPRASPRARRTRMPRSSAGFRNAGRIQTTVSHHWRTHAGEDLHSLCAVHVVEIGYVPPLRGEHNQAAQVRPRGGVGVAALAESAEAVAQTIQIATALVMVGEPHRQSILVGIVLPICNAGGCHQQVLSRRPIDAPGF